MTGPNKYRFEFEKISRFKDIYFSEKTLLLEGTASLHSIIEKLKLTWLLLKKRLLCY